MQLPELKTTRLETLVSVPDKGTLLLGGQKLTADIEIVAGEFQSTHCRVCPNGGDINLVCDAAAQCMPVGPVPAGNAVSAYSAGCGECTTGIQLAVMNSQIVNCSVYITAQL